MNGYAVITENDISKWNDETGTLYQFPKRYQKFLKQGTKVIYYKGVLRNNKYLSERLSTNPHYFGIAKIGIVYPDSSSEKNDYFATIENYIRFKNPILARENDEYLESITENRRINYWRDCVRQCDETFYNLILSKAGIDPQESLNNSNMSFLSDYQLTSGFEGQKRTVYTTTYERDPKLREQAIQYHGLTCNACGFDYFETYGEIGRNYIQVHHVTPIYLKQKIQKVNPKTDLVTLCANCHVMVHRDKKNVLTVNKLQTLLKK